MKKRDRELDAFMRGFSQALAATKPNLSEEQFAQILRKVMKLPENEKLMWTSTCVIIDMWEAAGKSVLTKSGSAKAHMFCISGIPSFRERPDFGAFRPSRRANGEP